MWDGAAVTGVTLSIPALGALDRMSNRWRAEADGSRGWPDEREAGSTLPATAYRDAQVLNLSLAASPEPHEAEARRH